MKRVLLRAWSRLLGTLGLRHRDAELAEELEAHILLMADESIRNGVAPAEALRRARVEFGGVDAAKESYRDQRGISALDAFAQDLRYGLRGIRNNPGFAAVAILSLAIGIGANTAIFSVVNSVLLQPLPFHEPNRIFAVREVVPNFTSSIPVNPLHAIEWAKHCPSLEQVALVRGARFQLTSGSEPESVIGAQVPHNLFALYGVRPILGRAFLLEEERDGANRAVILSEAIWRSHFHADPALVGRTISLNDRTFEVVGIVPAWFRLPFSAGIEPAAANVRFEIFTPLVLGNGELRPMGNFNYNAVTRLKPGATVEQALAEINTVQARFPLLAGSKTDLKATLIPVHELVAGRARLGLWMLAGSVGAVLLIVCINLANLMLSRMAARRHEAAIRTALGAGRGRQFRLVLAESLLLSVAGGTLGLLLARWSLQLLVAATTIDIPRLEEVRLDSHVMLFSLALTVLTGLLFGALPAWRLCTTGPQEALRAGSHKITDSRGGLRLRQALIGLEVGLSAALLIVAGLLTSSLVRLLEVDKGFDVNEVLTVDVRLAGNVYREDSVRERFFDRLLASAGAVPGVKAAGFITQLPTRGETWMDPISREGDNLRPEDRHVVNNRYASPGYFRAMNIAFRQGRAFDESDRGRGVAILSQKAARLLWPGVANPVGRRFIGEDGKPKTLVGVVTEVRATLNEEPPPMVYYPYWQRVPASVFLTVRAAGGAGSAAALRATLRRADANLPIPPIRSMQEVVDLSVAQRRFQLTLILAFAASALLVAALGIYGVVSYAVARRRNEIGIRMALGARRLQLLALVVGQGMTPVVFGLAAGVILAYFLGQTLRSLLFGVHPADPATIAAVASTLLAVGILACLIPAHRAASTDAIAALRME